MSIFSRWGHWERRQGNVTGKFLRGSSVPRSPKCERGRDVGKWRHIPVTEDRAKLAGWFLAVLLPSEGWGEREREVQVTQVSGTQYMQPKAICLEERPPVPLISSRTLSYSGLVLFKSPLCKRNSQPNPIQYRSQDHDFSTWEIFHH